MLKVGEVMTRDVITVRPTDSIKDVARLLVEHRVSGVPVVDDNGRLLGVVSEGDLIVKEMGPDAVERRPLARIFGDSPESREQLAKAVALTAGDAMTAPAITVDSETPLAEAAATMARDRINRLPVVDGDTLVGLVSRADVVRAFSRTDDEIAQAIRQDVLYNTLWLDPDKFDLSVTNGKVTISGQVERRSEAEMIERISNMVAGVTQVDSDVQWTIDDRDIRAPGKDLVSPY